MLKRNKIEVVNARFIKLLTLHLEYNERNLKDFKSGEADIYEIGDFSIFPVDLKQVDKMLVLLVSLSIPFEYMV